MNYTQLEQMYTEYKQSYGKNAYKYISKLLIEAKEIHKANWMKNPTKKGDHEQSWRAFKGKNMQRLLLYMIRSEVNDLGLTCVDGSKLERKKNLDHELDRVKRNIVVDYEEYGLHLPDVDIIIYNQKDYEVICVISSKVTLRERIAQTGYWKLKLLQSEVTKNVKVYFVTPDEDRTLSKKIPMLKGRAIVESDLDGSYVLTEEKIEESDKVKLFEHFIEDLRKTLESRN